MLRENAVEIAGTVIEFLTPHCERVSVAGSIRRLKPEVKDIEIVCIPKMDVVTDLFGEQHLSPVTDKISYPWEVAINGMRYKKFELGAVLLDLFIVIPPAQWGVIYTIRTGPAKFSEKIVTPKNKGGFLPSFLMVKDGQVMGRRKKDVYNTPEEEDFFRICEMSWIPPHERDSYV